VGEHGARGAAVNADFASERSSPASANFAKWFLRPRLVSFVPYFVNVVFESFTTKVTKGRTKITKGVGQG
jgi:hypothetical protein